MQRFFGTSNAAPKTTIADAVTSTETRIAGIEVKIKKLDGELQRYKDQLATLKPSHARQAVQERAIRVLQQKKVYEGQIASLTQQNFNMESTAMTTENLRNTMVTVEAMKNANKQLGMEFGKVDIDTVERMQDDMQELLEQANEIQISLSRSYAVPDDISEDELQAELAALEEFDRDDATYLDAVTAPTTLDTRILEEHGLQSPEPVRALQPATSGS